MSCLHQAPLRVLLVACLLSLVNCHGYLMVQFLQYNNQDSKRVYGLYCDQSYTKESACDPRFLLTADRYNPGGAGMYNYQQPGFYSDQDVINFGSTFAEMPNPVPFAMNYADNSGQIYITVTVADMDTVTGEELIDVFLATLEASGTNVKSLTLVSLYGGHTLSLRYWYTCNVFYYGSLCNNFCQEQDSTTGGHYTCDANGQNVCNSGWIGAATDCRTPHPCIAGVCQNGATCVPVGESDGGFRCNCTDAQFAGVLCEIDRCNGTICQNNGTCRTTSADGIATCHCLTGFTGEACEIANPCNSSPCKNGATCLSTATNDTAISAEFSCDCPSGFYGSLCEIARPNYCASEPCLNGGNLTSGNSSFTCACLSGFGGPVCDLLTTSATPTRAAATDISADADPLDGANNGTVALMDATGFSVAGVVAGGVIGFLVLAGVAVFLSVYLLRRQPPLAGTSVNLERAHSEVYETVSGEQPGEPVGEQVNEAYEAVIYEQPTSRLQ